MVEKKGKNLRLERSVVFYDHPVLVQTHYEVDPKTGVTSLRLVADVIGEPVERFTDGKL